MHGSDNRHQYAPSVMAAMFGRIPPGGGGFFAVRRLDMKGRKVEVPGTAIYSPIHCLFLITEGEALIEIGGELSFFHAGECAAIPAGQTFTVRYFDDCRGYMGGFSVDMPGDAGSNPMQAYAALRRWGNHKVQLGDEVSAYVVELFERLCRAGENGASRRIIAAYLAALLTEIEEADDGGGIAGISAEHELCNRFVEMVFERPDVRISAADYAGRLTVAPDTLRKTVTRLTGKSPSAWIREAVVLEAKTLLAGTALPVSEIAGRLGVDDPSYFSRMFRKATGSSPLAYRRECAKR